MDIRFYLSGHWIPASACLRRSGYAQAGMNDIKKILPFVTPAKAGVQ
jgi:hypothetical protein